MDNGVPLEQYADKKIGVYGGKFFPFHKGHVSFALEAAKQVDVLFVVLQYDEEYEKQLCVGTNFVPVEPRIRERWIVETFKDYPNIRVFSQYEHRSDDFMNDPLIGETYRELVDTVGHLDIIFSNTHEYDDYFAKWLPGVEHVVLLEDRGIIDISATRIRTEGVYDCWDYLPDAVKKFYTKRVAFCGWESAGKSFSAQVLAERFNTTYLPEYGRTFYVDELGGFNGIDLPEDYINIMAGHLFALHNSFGNKFICMDTDMIYTQFFHWKQTGQLHPVLDAAIKSNIEKIDTYFFLEPRNAFADDGSRFRVDEVERQTISDDLQQMYRDYGKELIIVDVVDGIQRLDFMADHIDHMIQ